MVVGAPAPDGRGPCTLSDAIDIPEDFLWKAMVNKVRQSVLFSCRCGGGVKCKALLRVPRVPETESALGPMDEVQGSL